MESSAKQDSLIGLLSSMDEERFLHVASTILGSVPTPFNKQVLARSVLSFFMNDGNRRNVVASIDEEEIPILRLVGLLGTASQRQLEAFCNGTNPYMLMIRIGSLCDRLVLFRTGSGFALNPVLEDDIDGLCSQSSEGAHAATKGPMVDQNTLRAVVNLLVNGSVPQRDANIHHFYKSGRLSQVFPQFDQSHSARMFELLRGLLIQAQAVVKAGSHATVDRLACRRLLALTPLDICIAALHSWYGANAPKAVEDTMRLLGGCSIDEQRLALFIAATADVGNAPKFVQDMEALGLVCRDPGSVEDALSLNAALYEPQVGMSNLTIDSNLTVSYYGVPDKDDILYLFSDVQKCDNLVEYSITKASFSRAIGLGVARDEIEKYLGDPGLKPTLDMWERSATRVRLYDGIVLECTPEVSYLLENIKELSSSIVARLGDGIFVMKRSDEERWRAMLAKALDMDELPMPLGDAMEGDRRMVQVFGHYEPPKVRHEDDHEAKAYASQSQLEWSQVKEELLAYAESQGCLSPELEELIESRRIVSRSQISRNFKYERLPSAGGLDFNAKLTLIRKAISRKDGAGRRVMRLELMDDDILAIPLELHGSGSRSMLRIVALPSGDERVVSIGSIYKATLVRSL